MSDELLEKLGARVMARYTVQVVEVDGVMVWERESCDERILFE